MFNFKVSILQYPAISSVRNRAPLFITCADNLRKDSVCVNWKRYLIEMIRKVGSGAVPFSVAIEKKVKREIKLVGDE